MEDLQNKEDDPLPGSSVWFYIKLTILIIILIIVAVAVFLFFSFKDEVPDLLSNLDQTKVLTEIQTKIYSGDLDDAIDISKKLNEERGGDDVEALTGLGFAYLHKGTLTFQEDENSKKALEVAEKIITQEPENPVGYHLKGYAYEITEDYDKAIENYAKSIEIHPEYLPAYGQIGHAYDLSGDKEQARSYYEKALSMKTTFDFALLNLGRLAYDEGDIDASEDYFNRALEYSFDNAIKSQALHMLGVIERDRGDLSEAQQIFRNAIEINPNLSTSWVLLAEIYVTRAEKERNIQHIKDAQDAANAALSIHEHDAYAYVVLGDIAQRYEKDLKKAEFYYEQARMSAVLDITLGAQEKENARREIEEMLGSLVTSQ